MSVICMPGVVQLHEADQVSAASEDVVETSIGPIRISVFRDIRLAEHAWRSLQSLHSAAPQQSFGWIKSWTRHNTPASGNDIAIICGRSKTGEVQFVWPFNIVIRNGLRCLQWIGQNYSNHNTGLNALNFSRQATPSDIKALLGRAGDIAGNVSAAIFKDQPAQCNGLPNPMKLLRHRPSAAQGKILLLDRDFETMYRNRFSGKLRNDIARKARNLDQLGLVEFGWASSDAERSELLNLIFRHQARSCAMREGHKPFTGSQHRAFFHDISCENSSKNMVMETAYLKIDGHPVAISSGVFYGDTFSLLLTSSDTGPASQYAPDTLLLHYPIEEACRRGLHFFDMGSADASCRSEWCDLDAPRFDSAIALDERGYLVTLPLLAEAALNRMKMAYPQSWAWAKA